METQILAKLHVGKNFPRTKMSTVCVKAQLSGASGEAVQLNGKQ